MTTRARGIYAPLPDTPQLESPPELTVWQTRVSSLSSTPALGSTDVSSTASSGNLSLGQDSEASAVGTWDEFYPDDDSDWEEDDWPLDRPLPLPEWGCERPELSFRTGTEYENFIALVSCFLHENITTFNYDTMSNFIMFCREYESQSENVSLKEFYRQYDPPLLPGRYTCVGLSADLATRLSAMERSYPGLKDSMYQVSCEEDVEFVETYCESSDPPILQCEKDHVLVCIKINIDGRSGVILLDSGYHVSRPVTVMEDSLWPQTSNFIATKRGNKMKTFSYRYCDSNSSYILWDVKEYHSKKLHKSEHNLIHKTRPYLSGVDIAERRNLTYPFKSLLSRDKNGVLTSGVYFKVCDMDKCQVTLFYKVNDDLVEYLKIPLSYFIYPPVIQENCDTSEKWIMNVSWENALDIVENYTGDTHDLRASLCYIATMLNQPSFLQQLAEINESINKISISN